mmetsp:Transcript_9444/g.34661  ORF Transcript_9444/g.34661 Transcript_9444/m.34661 type:complete len:705 (+) Transcript_9444:228-2342(+)
MGASGSKGDAAAEQLLLRNFNDAQLAAVRYNLSRLLASTTSVAKSNSATRAAAGPQDIATVHSAAGNVATGSVATLLAPSKGQGPLVSAADSIAVETLPKRIVDFSDSGEMLMDHRYLARVASDRLARDNFKLVLKLLLLASKRDSTLLLACLHSSSATASVGDTHGNRAGLSCLVSTLTTSDCQLDTEAAHELFLHEEDVKRAILACFSLSVGSKVDWGGDVEESRALLLHLRQELNQGSNLDRTPSSSSLTSVLAASHETEVLSSNVRATDVARWLQRTFPGCSSSLHDHLYRCFVHTTSEDRQQADGMPAIKEAEGGGTERQSVLGTVAGEEAEAQPEAEQEEGTDEGTTVGSAHQKCAPLAALCSFREHLRLTGLEHDTATHFLLTHVRACCLASSLPGTCKWDSPLHTPHLLYTDSTHGDGLANLLRACAGYTASTLVLFKGNLCRDATSSTGFTAEASYEPEEVIVGVVAGQGIRTEKVSYACCKGTGTGALLCFSPEFRVVNVRGSATSSLPRQGKTSFAGGTACIFSNAGVGYGHGKGFGVGGATESTSRLWVDAELELMQLRRATVQSQQRAPPSKTAAVWDLERAPLWERQGYAPVRYKLSRVEAWGLGGASGREAAARARSRETTFQEQRRMVDRRKMILGESSGALDPRVDEQQRQNRKTGNSSAEQWQQSTEKQMLDMLSTDFRGSGGSMM